MINKDRVPYDKNHEILIMITKKNAVLVGKLMNRLRRPLKKQNTKTLFLRRYNTMNLHRAMFKSYLSNKSIKTVDNIST